MKPLRVLVVDDNEDAADTLAELLSIRGAEVRACYNADDAMSLLDRFTPDAAVLDIHMPGKDGCQLARLLRVALGSVVLIAMTGVSDEEARARTAAAGFNRHLTKAGPPAELLDALGGLHLKTA